MEPRYAGMRTDMSHAITPRKKGSPGRDSLGSARRGANGKRRAEEKVPRPWEIGGGRSRDPAMDLGRKANVLCGRRRGRSLGQDRRLDRELAHGQVKVAGLPGATSIVTMRIGFRRSLIAGLAMQKLPPGGGFQLAMHREWRPTECQQHDQHCLQQPHEQ